MIVLLFLVLVVAGVVLAVRSTRRRAAARPLTWTVEPSARLRMRSARKGERL